MQVNYSMSYVEQLVHLFKKVGPESTIYNFDEDSAVQFTDTTIKYVKSKFPKVGIVNTLFELGRVNNIRIVDYNKQLKKADGATTNGRYIENTVYFIDRIKVLCDSTKSTGFVAMNLPLCYNSGWFAYQPKLFQEIAKQNDYGTTYFRISDYSGNYTVAVDRDIDSPVIKDMMYKYQHTADVRLAVTYTKSNEITKETSTTKFVFKEDE